MEALRLWGGGRGVGEKRTGGKSKDKSTSVAPSNETLNPKPGRLSPM